MSLSKVVTDDTLERMARHKGRAYQCLRCCHQGGKEVIDVKARIECHIMKTHLSLDQVPFYCSLCLFRCSDKATLLDHVTKFKRHEVMAKMKGVSGNTECLKENANPYQIGLEDYFVFSQAESTQIFLNRMRAKKGSSSNQDLLSEACQEFFPEDLGSGLATPVSSSSSDLTPAALQQPPLTSAACGNGVPDQAAQLLNLFSGLTQTLMTTIESQQNRQAPWKELLSPVIDLATKNLSSAPAVTVASDTEYQPYYPVTVPPHVVPPSVSYVPTPITSTGSTSHSSTDLQRQPSTSSTTATNTATPMDLSKPKSNCPLEPEDLSAKNSTERPSTPYEATENILPQLLGTDSHADELPSETAVCKTTSPSDATGPPQQAPNNNSELIEVIRQGHKEIVDEIEKNSRSVRCLKEAVNGIKDVMVGVHQSINDLVSTIRMQAREERRREERREEERQRERDENRRQDDQCRTAAVKRKHTEERSPKLKSVLGNLYPENNKKRK